MSLKSSRQRDEAEEETQLKRPKIDEEEEDEKNDNDNDNVDDDESKPWAKLISLTDGFENILISKRQHSIGRSRTCDTQLKDEAISSHHCIIYKHYKKENGECRCDLILEDNSKRGIEFNNKNSERMKQRLIKSGDVIGLKLKDQTVRYQFKVLIEDDICVSRRDCSWWEQRFEDRYKVLEWVGKGQFAHVHKVELIGTGKTFAVKTLNKTTIMNNDKLLKALKSETAIMQNVKHDNITKIFDTFDTGDEFKIVMEWIPEGELFDLIASKNGLTERQTRTIFRQLFDAIQFLHGMHVVHRDLKPENILMVSRENLIVKIADFGLATWMHDRSVRMSTLCGTPTYVAPEILTPKPVRSYNAAVDMWSLGVILYITLCGFPPFYKADGRMPLAEQIRTADYSFPVDHWGKKSLNSRNLVKELLKINPRERLTATLALEHPFMTTPGPSDDLLPTLALMPHNNAADSFNQSPMPSVAQSTLYLSTHEQLPQVESTLEEPAPAQTAGAPSPPPISRILTIERATNNADAPEVRLSELPIDPQDYSQLAFLTGVLGSEDATIYKTAHEELPEGDMFP
ncbi:3061_t:CDS:10 [Paraglomus occultum]|uniref:3061_t:CDS:1 n=1 Tax=Paraglomus occultum TaxID=144539 RepID=A0A9N8ZCK1_9GLOM|nr:3061_t:CDS:10 [Paraglomus occultum]